jgi:heme/copper-type cytochrome/quinol oxidase subunit 4
MRYLFWTVAGIGLIYFSSAKRRVDFFTLGFVGACIYFAPGFFGYVLYPVSGGFLPVKVIPDAFLVMAVVLTAILIAGILWDLLGPRHGPTFVLAGWKFGPELAVAIGVIGFVGTWLTVGDKLLIVDKMEVLRYINRWYILWTTGAAIGAALSFEARKKALLGVAVVLLAFDLIVGFRASIAMTLIALFMLMVSKKRPRRLIHSWKTGLLLACVLAAVVLYKGLFMDVKAGEWGMVVQYVTDAEWYLSVLAHSEPFITQAILNEVLQSGFTVGMSHLWSLFYQAMLFAPELGAHPVSFNDLFQPVLFPGSDHMGMANNLWAEAVSTGGWWMLIAFVIGFSSMLGLGSYLLASRDGAIRAGAAVAFTWLAVYAHRNDMLNQLSFEKRTLLIWVACVLGSMLVVTALSSAKGPSAKQQPETR